MRRRLYRSAGVVFPVTLGGCQMGVLHPQGPVGAQEASLIGITFGIMMIVVAPVIFMTLLFAWRYRATGNARYEPAWARSRAIELTVWGIPLAIILFLGILDWRTTHQLDPYRPLDVAGKPLTIQVVALDWKWLFIYPDQQIASVNEIEIPVGTQVNFLITSDTVMNVFFIPELGTQIYAMSGMQTKVHLLAKNPGTYPGISANFSGDGFADMRFSAVAVDQQQFAAWVTKTRKSPLVLNAATYAGLAAPSSNSPPAYYGTASPGLFQQIIATHSGQKTSSAMQMGVTQTATGKNQ